MTTHVVVTQNSWIRDKEDAKYAIMDKDDNMKIVKEFSIPHNEACKLVMEGALLNRFREELEGL